MRRRATGCSTKCTALSAVPDFTTLSMDHRSVAAQCVASSVMACHFISSPLTQLLERPWVHEHLDPLPGSELPREGGGEGGTALGRERRGGEKGGVKHHKAALNAEWNLTDSVNGRGAHCLQIVRCLFLLPLRVTRRLSMATAFRRRRHCSANDPRE